MQPYEHDLAHGPQAAKGGRRFPGYEDGAPRRWQFGILAHVAPVGAPAVPDAAIGTHGRPASAMPGHGYCSAPAGPARRRA